MHCEESHNRQLGYALKQSMQDLAVALKYYPLLQLYEHPVTVGKPRPEVLSQTHEPLTARYGG